MTRTRISIVKWGCLKRQLNSKILQRWNSKLFVIGSFDEIAYMPQVENANSWQHLSDKEVCNRLQPKHNTDITIAITEYSLEDNYYMRKVTDKLTIISLSEIGDILQYYHIPIENFILKNIYEIVTLLHAYPNLPNTRDQIPDIIHEENRSCLFDMNGIKTDVIYFFTNKPSLCLQCETKLLQRQLPANFVSNLKRELKRMRKPLFNRICDFVKCYPKWSIFIAVVGQLLIGLLAGLFANYLFFLFKG
jgi:hypothetical protein